METNDARIEKILGMIEDLEPTLKTIKKLQESGLMSILDALAEQSDVMFNYASSMDILGAASALIRFIPLISSAVGDLDPERLESTMRTISWNTLFSSVLTAIESMGREIGKIEMPSSRPGIMALLSEARSPETTFLLRLMRGVVRDMMDQEMKNRGSSVKPHE
ncbi:MAG: hypothetical protein QXN26_00500 [Thermoplasmataceae archaeon]